MYFSLFVYVFVNEVLHVHLASISSKHQVVISFHTEFPVLNIIQRIHTLKWQDEWLLRCESVFSIPRLRFACTNFLWGVLKMAEQRQGGLERLMSRQTIMYSYKQQSNCTVRGPLLCEFMKLWVSLWYESCCCLGVLNAGLFLYTVYDIHDIVLHSSFHVYLLNTCSNIFSDSWWTFMSVRTRWTWDIISFKICIWIESTCLEGASTGPASRKCSTYKGRPRGKANGCYLHSERGQVWWQL